MLPRLFNRIEATSQTTKFYKPMHLAEHTQRARVKEWQSEREEREREEEQPKLKEWKKKTITRLIYFHLAVRDGRRGDGKREREG